MVYNGNFQIIIHLSPSIFFVHVCNNSFTEDRSWEPKWQTGIPHSSHWTSGKPLAEWLSEKVHVHVRWSNQESLSNTVKEKIRQDSVSRFTQRIVQEMIFPSLLLLYKEEMLTGSSKRFFLFVMWLLSFRISYPFLIVISMVTCTLLNSNNKKSQ